MLKGLFFALLVSATFSVLAHHGDDGGGGGSGPTTRVIISITTDNYANETSWQLTNSSNTVVASIAQGAYSNATTYQEVLDLTNGNYTFQINDSWGDGICCGYGTGSYRITVDGFEVASGGSFGSSESKTITVDHNANKADLVISILTDNYGYETSWQLTAADNTVIASEALTGSFNPSIFEETIELPGGDYIFVINDSYGDGICCGYGTGSYSITLGGVQIASGGEFGASESVPISVARDIDNDGVRDLQDNCPDVHNTGQSDTDDDDVGNDCEGTTNHDFGVCFLSPDEVGVGENGLCPSDDEGLTRGEQLWSADNKYSVTINKGLSIIEYTSQGQIVRHVNALRNGNTFRTTKARLTHDGNFQLLDHHDNVLGSTGTSGSNANYMYLSEGGDLLIECLDGSVVWSSDSSKIETSSCQNTSIANVAKSLEMAEKLRATSELLCTDPNDIVTKCPSGKRYQFLSVDDSFVKLENQGQIEKDLMSFLLGVDVNGGSGFKFLVDAWTAQNMSVTKCLDRPSSGLNDCFFNEAEIDEDSLFSLDQLPTGIDLSDINYQLTLSSNDDVDVPNVVVDNKTYVVNQCHRHTTNLYYLDNLSTFNSNKLNKDDFIDRYFPKQDCLIDGRNESLIIGAASNYQDEFTKYLAASLQAIRFAEEAAILSVPFILSDGLLGITLAGTELEFLISSARVFGEVVGFTQGVYAVATDFYELSSCQTDVCRTRVGTDIAMNSIMLGQQIYSNLRANGKTVIQARAADITESMVDLSAEINRPNSMITQVNMPTSQLNHYRIMALAARDENFAVIMEVLNNRNESTLFDAVTNLSDSEFKKTKFVEKFLTETDAIVEDPQNGTLNETRLQEFIDKLNSPCGL